MILREGAIYSLNNYPHGLTLISRRTIIDPTHIATGITAVNYGGVSGGHDSVVAVGEGSDTRRTNPDTGGYSDTAGSGSYTCDRTSNADGSSPAHMTDPGRSGGPGSTGADSANTHPRSRARALATDTTSVVTGECWAGGEANHQCENEANA
jgi:hypothetical protein